MELGTLDGNVFRGRQTEAEIGDLARRERSELCVSAALNLSFWAGLTGAVALLSHCRTLPGDLPLLVAGLVCLGIGGIVYTLQLGRFGDTLPYSCSVVRQYLDNMTTHEEFTRKMQRRCTSSARISAQLSVRDGIVSKSPDKNHWSKKERAILKDVAFGSCVGNDFAAAKDGVAWPDKTDAHACRILVKKTFRVRDEMSNIIFKAQVEDFCNTHNFQENRRYLHFDYLLGFEHEKDTRPLVETYLILGDSKSSFYGCTLYRVMFYTLSDCVYRLLFHWKTRNLGVLDIEKTIKA